MNIASLILKLCSLGLVVGAAGLWASAGVDARPKNRDEQMLVGGALWTQTLIPIGLIISAIVDDKLDFFVHAYYLFTGWVLLGVNGVMLIVGECRKLKKQRRTRLGVTLNMDPPQLRQSFDQIYCSIGVLMSLASMVTVLIVSSMVFLVMYGVKYFTMREEVETTTMSLLSTSPTDRHLIPTTTAAVTKTTTPTTTTTTTASELETTTNFDDSLTTVKIDYNIV